MLTPRYYQRAAINAIYSYFMNNVGNPLLVLPTGCHAPGTGIVMWDGSIKAVEDVAVSDLLAGPDGKPRRVKRLFSGHEMMYRITPKKGESFIVNESHVLSLQGTNEGKPHQCCSRAGQITNISVREYLGKSKYWKHVRKLYRSGADFSEQRPPELDPWTLGALIGDGCLKYGTTFTNPDIEALDGVYDTITGMGLCLGAWREKNDCYQITIKDQTAHCASANKLTAILRHLGLFGTLAHEKFIPEHYKTGSRETRLQILAGLLDTDGHLNENKNFDYISKSKQLSEDVLFIARSLGFWATLSKEYKECQTGAGGFYYRVYISGDLEKIPTRVKRKQARAYKRQKNPMVTGFDIDPVGIGSFFGFEIDDDHLYLTNDFFVHHNSGKSLVLGLFVREVLEQWPDQRILIITHVKELIAQNFAELIGFWPEAPAGIYSAGLGRRDHQAQILFAGIQSVHKKAELLQRADLILIDEAHLIPRKSNTTYRRFLDTMLAMNPHMKVIGLTATPYRLDSGMLHKGEDALFTDIAYEVSCRDLVQRDFLAPLISKSPDTQLDVSGVGKRSGEFIPGQLEAAVDVDHVTKAAVDEIVAYGEDRRSWLVFGSGVQHCRHIAEAIERRGYSFACIFGDTPAAERDAIIRQFKAFEIRCLVSMGVLTTGFNAPAVDLLAMLRPTQSTGLYVQIAGRGMRRAPGKDNCLVLDFAGNVKRHGPVDAVNPKDPQGGEGGEAPVKMCPECQSLILIAIMECPDCGYQWPPPEPKIERRATTRAIMTDGTPEWVEVDDVSYFRHNKIGKPPSLRVEYRCGFVQHRKWVCFEHQGRPRQSAEMWWRKRSQEPAPATVDEALDEAPYLPKPAFIAVRPVGKFTEIVGERFA